MADALKKPGFRSAFGGEDMQNFRQFVYPFRRIPFPAEPAKNSG